LTTELERWNELQNKYRLGTIKKTEEQLYKKWGNENVLTERKKTICRSIWSFFCAQSLILIYLVTDLL